MNKQLIKNAFLHLKKIHTHRKWVRYYGKQMGLSFWQRWTHDLSKYSPTEFLESIRYYQGTSSPINAAKKDKGYSVAWFHHKGRNPHHYEYWIDKLDSGGTPIAMPYKYAVELICDYLAAARAYMGKDFGYIKEFQWWQDKRKNCAMNEQTKAFVSMVLEDFAKQESDDALESYCFHLYIDKNYISNLYALSKWGLS